MNPIQVAFKSGFKKEAFKPMEAKITDFQSGDSGDTGADFSGYNDNPRAVQMSNNSGQDNFGALEEFGSEGLGSTMSEIGESPVMKATSENMDFDIPQAEDAELASFF